MSYPELRRFEFHQNGHGNRRDRDALPRVLILEIGPDSDRVQFHVAGDEYVRTAHVIDAALGEEILDGLEPMDAFRLGMKYESVRHKQEEA